MPIEGNGWVCLCMLDLKNRGLIGPECTLPSSNVNVNTTTGVRLCSKGSTLPYRRPGLGSTQLNSAKESAHTHTDLRMSQALDLTFCWGSECDSTPVQMSCVLGVLKWSNPSIHPFCCWLCRDGSPWQQVKPDFQTYLPPEMSSSSYRDPKARWDVDIENDPRLDEIYLIWPQDSLSSLFFFQLDVPQKSWVTSTGSFQHEGLVTVWNSFHPSCFYLWSRPLVAIPHVHNHSWRVDCRV